MTLLKKCLSFLLAVFLCLGLAACGGSDDPVEETVGDDWRNSGEVVAGGTITRSDGDVDVLVIVDDNSASFYWDEPEQVLFDKVYFPFTIPNAQKYFKEISFADLTANGESDVEISFITNSGKMYLTWLWYLDGYYMFRGDLSTYTIDGRDLSEYVGRWQWANESLWLEIDEDATWIMFDDQEDIVQTGSLWLDEDGIVLYFDETADVLHFDVTVSGDLVNSENDIMFVPADSVPANNEVDMSEYIGLWEYVGENLWLCIYDDETWAFFNDQEDVIASGTLWADEFGVTLYFDGSGDVMQLDIAVSGDLLDIENNGTLVPASKIESRVPCFTRNGLEFNAEVGKGTYLLKNGICSYVNVGDGYGTGDCYWEVIKNIDITHDGIREIQFDAICYIPLSSVGNFKQEFIVTSLSELYDFYTGRPLKVNTDNFQFNETDRNENCAVQTVEWNGQSYELELYFGTNTEFYVGDWFMVFTKSYMVYLPEGYDGLVFAAQPAVPTYGNLITLYNYTEDNIMNNDLMDPYDYLMFNICD